MAKLRVAIIGAGPSGLSSAKYAKEMSIDFVVFEQWSKIGGIWVYTDYTDLDEYGYPVLSPMYKGLTTNLSKESMAFYDLKFPEDKGTYLNQEEVRTYLNKYADHFQLKPFIKFNTLVTLIKPNGDKWSVETEYKINGKKSTEIFDAVVICTGHHNSPKVPNIPGVSTFKGTIIHSRMYRKLKDYKEKVVLIVGGGFSGLDILEQVSSVAKRVIFSYRKVIRQPTNKKNVITKQGEIIQINESSVTFDDGTTENIDSIILCTGYNYSYPFLDKSCGITDGDFVQPLYKHIINVNKPTMGFIGVAIYICPFVTFELQARFFINSILRLTKLCSQEDMLKDIKEDFENRCPKGCIGREHHKIHDHQRSYYSELAQLGNTFDIPQHYIDSYNEDVKKFFNLN